MTLEENKEIARLVYEEYINNRKLELADELFAENFTDHGAPQERQGLAGLKESTRLMLVAFPDLKFKIDYIIAEGDIVHVRGMLSGTLLGTYQGGPPTGKYAEWSAMDDFRIENGLIAERWTERNNISRLAQTGKLKM